MKPIPIDVEEKFSRYVEKNNITVVLYKYGKQSKLERIINHLFLSDNLETTRTNISRKVFMGNTNTYELDFYRDGMVKLGLIYIDKRLEANNYSVEYWCLHKQGV